jgi:neutral ceramidase
MTRATSPVRADGGSTETQWRVGAATRGITPEKSMRLSGFASRTDRSDGTLDELHAKAAAFEDGAGTRAVVASAEVLFVSRDVRADVETRVQDAHGVAPDRLVLNASHTHYGPEYREPRYVMYDMDDEERALSDDYQDRLTDELVEVAGEALDALEPADLRYGHARCGIGMNRRYPTEGGIRFRQHPDGPVDHEVPVLAAYRDVAPAPGGDEGSGNASDRDPEAVLFGYACHPTCLPTDTTKFSGDWAGEAMALLEDHYDGATALFLQGCGGDVKAYPQNSRAVSEQHGQTLANAVRAALNAPTTAVHGPLRSTLEEVELSFESAPPREDLAAALDSDDQFQRRHARLLLDQIAEHGEVPTEHPYRTQALGFGDDLTMIPMSGEVLSGYAHRIRDALEGNVWPMGYSNGDFTYLSTDRALHEGGYEGGGAITYTAYPGPLKPGTEDRVVGTALALAERVGADRTDER